MKSPTPRLACIAALLATSLSCGPTATREPAQVLLYCGTGTSPNDVRAVEAILEHQHLSSDAVDAAELCRMSAPQLRAYRLIIVPGGNYLRIAEAWTPAAAAKIRDAVAGGVNYLGICAGALLAGMEAPDGLDLTGGAKFGFFELVNQGVHKAAVEIATVGSAAIENYWEDGPQLAGWGEVVGRYPDGAPAIAQGSFGRGHVLLIGTHPEAPESWRHGMAFNTSTNASHALAGALIDAAFKGSALPHF